MRRQGPVKDGYDYLNMDFNMESRKYGKHSRGKGILVADISAFQDMLRHQL